MSFFKQLYDNFEEGACALFVAVMVLCLFLQVAMRIAVGSSLAWTEELSRYSFLLSAEILVCGKKTFPQTRPRLLQSHSFPNKTQGQEIPLRIDCCKRHIYPDY